jgi:hypothetical protein
MPARASCPRYKLMMEAWQVGYNRAVFRLDGERFPLLEEALY